MLKYCNKKNINPKRTKEVIIPRAAELKTTGFGYAGADLFAAGFNLGKKAVEVCGLSAGDKAFVWGLASMPNRGERTKGAIAGVESMGVEVVYQEIPDNVMM